MSDELKIEGAPVDPAPEAKTEAPVAPTQVEVSPVETQARDQGWVSKEEWVESGRDESEWRPAKEFVDRGELYKSIHTTKRELKQTQAALQALQGHHKMVYEKAYQQALTDLKVQKRQAIRAGEFEQLEEIEDRIDQLQQTHQEETQKFNQVVQAANPSTPPEFQEFVDRNPWYMMDKGMRNEADAIGFIYLNNGGTRDNLLSHVEKEIKKKFPEKFGVKKAAPSAVAPSSRQANKAAPAADTDSLSESELEIARTFERMGVMSASQYKQELKKAKG